MPRSQDDEVPYIKWHGAMYTVGPPLLWTPNQKSKTEQMLKSSVYKWSCAVHTCVIPGQLYWLGLTFSQRESSHLVLHCYKTPQDPA